MSNYIINKTIYANQKLNNSCLVKFDLPKNSKIFKVTVFKKDRSPYELSSVSIHYVNGNTKEKEENTLLLGRKHTSFYCDEGELEYICDDNGVFVFKVLNLPSIKIKVE